MYPEIPCFLEIGVWKGGKPQNPPPPPKKKKKKESLIRASSGSRMAYVSEPGRRHPEGLEKFRITLSSLSQPHQHVVLCFAANQKRWTSLSSGSGLYLNCIFVLSHTQRRVQQNIQSKIEDHKRWIRLDEKKNKYDNFTPSLYTTYVCPLNTKEKTQKRKSLYYLRSSSQQKEK